MEPRPSVYDLAARNPLATLAVAGIVVGVGVLVLARLARDDDEVPPLRFSGPMAFGDADQAEAHPS